MLMLLCTVFASCKKEKEATFDYPLEMLYEKWHGTHMQLEYTWVDIATDRFSKLIFVIEFNPDGTCYGCGVIGVCVCDCTYSAITTCVGDIIYAEYTPPFLQGG